MPDLSTIKATPVMQAELTLRMPEPIITDWMRAKHPGDYDHVPRYEFYPLGHCAKTFHVGEHAITPDGPLLRITEWPRERSGECSSFVELDGVGWGLPLPQLFPERIVVHRGPAVLDFSTELSLAWGC